MVKISALFFTLHFVLLVFLCYLKKFHPLSSGTVQYMVLNVVEKEVEQSLAQEQIIFSQCDLFHDVEQRLAPCWHRPGGYGCRMTMIISLSWPPPTVWPVSRTLPLFLLVRFGLLKPVHPVYFSWVVYSRLWQNSDKMHCLLLSLQRALAIRYLSNTTYSPLL